MPDPDLPLPPAAALILALALLGLAGLFAAAEAALFSLSAARLSKMEQARARAAGAIRNLMEVPRRLIVTLSLGADTFSLAAAFILAWLAASYGLGRLDWAWLPQGLYRPLILAVIIALPLVLLLAFALPRAVGLVYSDQVARATSYPLWLFMRASFPFRWTFRTTADLILRALGAHPERLSLAGLAQEDIRELVEESSREGLLDLTERELLVNLLRSGEISAGQVMTPRQQIVAISVEERTEAARALMAEHDYSRFPVYEGERDRIVGVITARDLLRIRLAERRGALLSIREVMRPPLFVPESRRLRDLLLDFKRRRIHLALVADEFGAVSGLVTMEDVLEEIVGEVQEEEEPELINLGAAHWRVLGRMEISDFNARTGASISPVGIRTLAGLVLARLGRRPRPGDEVRAAGFLFKVVEAKGIIIHQLEVKREEEQ